MHEMPSRQDLCALPPVVVSSSAAVLVLPGMLVVGVSPVVVSAVVVPPPAVVDVTPSVLVTGPAVSDEVVCGSQSPMQCSFEPQPASAAVERVRK
ncbi:hypothetical protein OV079_29140 [Nannocystis pusilla]|uniref:Uncharacterized protein n=1 Tax=Nannocystis pusilla TaxID=889268 RepID=A0A9X3ESM4_9BACT|nr:hypothetical protein [Nannocystis pusilla]MCY1009559.1 hypothetical protein [Nannocystis pusilla]